MTRTEFDAKVAAHALWLADPATGTRGEFYSYELRDETFVGIDLSNTIIQGVHMNGSTWVNVNLSGASITDCEMANNNFVNVNTTGAMITGTELMGSTSDASWLNSFEAGTGNIISYTADKVFIGEGINTMAGWMLLTDDQIVNDEGLDLSWWTTWKDVINLTVTNTPATPPG